MKKKVIAFILTLITSIDCWPYDPEEVGYNLNENKRAASPADYWGEWPNHKYHPSPDNWRFPFYTLFVDRFVNGDPANDDVNGSSFERDIYSNQLRHGGDALGLVDSLDYIQGMGIKGIYIAGTIFINQPWGADGYSALDTTLLDRHIGDIATWRHVVTEIHKRGMYILMDNTVATLGDLLGFEGYLNATTPFNRTEHKVLWKSDRKYVDFRLGDSYNETCDYPRFWDEKGYLISPSETGLKGCFNSEFDQYGDMEAFGVYPDWQRQLTKFASVQDRLREWLPSVREKLTRHSCLLISQLDVDGFRYDKATQSTVDALGDISDAYRTCARRVGKENFFLPGEITGGNTFGAIYIGRGRQADMRASSIKDAVKLTYKNETNFIRKAGKSALDAGAFHYSIYRSLTRFLHMDGNLAAGYDTPVNWAQAWHEMLLTNDFINTNTQKFDPRHMFGATNQDVFRWPALKDGVQRSLLALYIVTLHLPGIPLIFWGEEQAFYLLDNTASNYIFGRQPMSSALAWQIHGCYSLNSSQYYDWPLGPALHGCRDHNVSLDHRDPTHSVRNILKTMHQMRLNFPAVNDGFNVHQLSNMTRQEFFPGSLTASTEIGLWSVLRGGLEEIQDSEISGPPVWLIYQNDNTTREYRFDCSSKEKALLSPFDAATTVKNLFYPYDEHTLKQGPVKLGIDKSTSFNGCLDTLRMDAWGFSAYVPKKDFIRPDPMITRFIPGHDARLLSKSNRDDAETIPIELLFSDEMDCDSVTHSLSLNSTTHGGRKPWVDSHSVKCSSMKPTETKYSGEVPGIWKWSAKLSGVHHGVHQLRIDNPKSNDRKRSTGVVDVLFFRVGTLENPIVFPRTANYSRTLLHKNKKGLLYVNHHAAGADSYRYSTNWGSSWSNWRQYKGGNDTLNRQSWQGTKKQQWKGEHVIVEYWNRMAGSSSHVQHGDLDWRNKHPRRFPHLFWNGPYNEYGFDSGIENRLHLNANGEWSIRFMTEWPAVAQVNVWGLNPDGKPDISFVYGDSNNDSVIDRLPPSSLKKSFINITDYPPFPYLAWEFLLNDGTFDYKLVPTGSMNRQIALFFILLIFPASIAVSAVFGFKYRYCRVVSNKGEEVPTSTLSKFFQGLSKTSKRVIENRFPMVDQPFPKSRRTVLIATMEYNIPDWNIKIKIGGLGVISKLMGDSLGHLNLIWVVPCVGSEVYGPDEEAPPMEILLDGQNMTVTVQYHQFQNITYVILDAPIFRRQGKDDPYPARMDDLESAVYYSAWNQCIAHTMKRFHIDIYHINDYHGAIAPLYMLPETIPICLSLHNAEFQGLWPIRFKGDMDELCRVFNLDKTVVRKYIQFGEVFNLLHAAASYLRIHQNGLGIVGVSEKYAERTHKRYPIFWGLSDVEDLPNPDPTDVSDYDPNAPRNKGEEVETDKEVQEKARNKRTAQEWAGLDQNPEAQLFIFVGRWSSQKGIDLIADIFPRLLVKREDVQLICVGPIIDLHGKLAALKLHKLMETFPTRVYSRPKFTMVPGNVKKGADFVLIPSRDEPFGLVAVEYGRDGVLGIGARVGGLGQMPGWWYSVESISTTHLLYQFKTAIKLAMKSKPGDRALMRVRSKKQRFPVSQWVRGLDKLHDEAIQIHHRIRLEEKAVKGSTLSWEDPESILKRLWNFTISCNKSAKASLDENLVVSSKSAGTSQSIDTIELGCDKEDRQQIRPASLEALVGSKQSFRLQNVDPTFSDEKGEFTGKFLANLEYLNKNNSKRVLCIENFLIDSQKSWFQQIKNAQKGRRIRTSSLGYSADDNPSARNLELAQVEADKNDGNIDSEADALLTCAQRTMLLRIGDWPGYSFLLAIGQILSLNSHQISLLTGEVGQSASKLYLVASIYLVGSIVWWFLFRICNAALVLSAPFYFYSAALVLIGCSHLGDIAYAAEAVQRLGASLYAFAAASGSVYFALNFGDEGGSQARDCVFRACMIQGTQQIFVVALWHWGSILMRQKADTGNVKVNAWIIQAVTFPISVLLCALGFLIYSSLPDCYRCRRAVVPSFYRSIFRRRVILWFFASVFVQNLFLSSQYGRSWSFLWSSRFPKIWEILLLVFVFFVIVWCVMLAYLKRLSQNHTWLLPIFAVGLGAPRWAQIWWGASGIGQYLPWAGNDTTGAMASRVLWLWLGVLDSAQGIGFGMALLQTLTRFHICFTLLAAQVFGSIATILGRKISPNGVGPGPVHPNIAVGDPMGGWFWSVLLLQLAVPLGFFFFFRNEQLSKP